MTGFTTSFLTPALVARAGLEVELACVESACAGGDVVEDEERCEVHAGRLETAFGRFHLFVLRLAPDARPRSMPSSSPLHDALERDFMV